MAVHHDDSQEINLRQYMAIIRQRYWLVLLVVLLAAIPTAVYLYLEPPVYLAQCRILIEQSRGPIEEERSSTGPGIDPEIEKTLLFSRPVMNSVLAKLEPGFERLSDARKAALVSQFKSRLDMAFHKSSVYSASQSALAALMVIGQKPQEVAQAANLVAQTYIDETRKRELAESNAWIEWFGEQLAEMHQKVKKAEEGFQNFKLDKGIIGLEERKEELATKVQTASSMHLEAKLNENDAVLKLTALKNARAKGAIPATAAFVSYGYSLVGELKSQLDSAKAELSEKSVIFGPKHTVIIAFKDKIRSLETQIADRQNEIIKAQENTVERLTASKESLAKTLETYKEEVQKLNKLELQYSILEREVATSRELYDLLVERRKRSALSSAVNRRQISVVEPAVIPHSPMPKKMYLKVIVAVIIGLSIGIGLVFLLDYLEMTLKTPDDIERQLGLWVVGIIPRFQPKLEKTLGYSGAIARSASKKTRRNGS